MSARTYNYQMGFQVNGTSIPDPFGFSGKNSALDTMGGRDGSGTLHRKMVARKHPLKLQYRNIDWLTIQTIMGLLTGESFQFTFQDPLEGTITIKAYAGDLDWEVVQAPGGQDYIGNLNFSVIEF